MAETTFTHNVGMRDGDPEQGAAGVGTAVNILGAVASLALMAGVGVWGYKLVMRDVSGVPVVRSIEGPMRVQPENPGGRQADHQGLAVNAVAADGVAEKPADRLMLAPRPVELAEEDTPMSQIAPTAAATNTPTAEAAPQTETPAPTVASQETLAAFQNGAVDQLVEELIAGTTPVLEETDAPADKPADVVARITQPEPLKPAEALPEQELKPQPAVLTGPGLPRSLRPQVRPARSRDASIIAAVAQANAPLEVDPDDLPVGTRLAQLGAYDSADVARSEWDRLNTKFGDYLEGKSRVIQRASSGGRTFYRLRAMGFDDISDARRFCSALVAEKADCIPVTIR